MKSNTLKERVGGFTALVRDLESNLVMLKGQAKVNERGYDQTSREQAYERGKAEAYDSALTLIRQIAKSIQDNGVVLTWK